MTARRRRRLPPHAKQIVAMLNDGKRTVLFGGGLVCGLDWEIGRAWWRFVLPPDQAPDNFELGFVRGIDVLVLHRPTHDPLHVAAAVRALKQNGARLVVAVALPRGELAFVPGPIATGEAA